MKDEIKIITLGDIFKNLETEEKAFKFKDYITNLQEENERLSKEVDMWNRKYNEQIDIINRMEKDLKEMYITFGEFNEEYTEKKIRELKEGK